MPCNPASSPSVDSHHGCSARQALLWAQPERSGGSATRTFPALPAPAARSAATPEQRAAELCTQCMCSPALTCAPAAGPWRRRRRRRRACFGGGAPAPGGPGPGRAAGGAVRCAAAVRGCATAAGRGVVPTGPGGRGACPGLLPVCARAVRACGEAVAVRRSGDHGQRDSAWNVRASGRKTLCKHLLRCSHCPHTAVHRAGPDHLPRPAAAVRRRAGPVRRARPNPMRGQTLGTSAAWTPRMRRHGPPGRAPGRGARTGARAWCASRARATGGRAPGGAGSQRSGPAAAAARTGGRRPRTCGSVRGSSAWRTKPGAAPAESSGRTRGRRSRGRPRRARRARRWGATRALLGTHRAGSWGGLLRQGAGLRAGLACALRPRRRCSPHAAHSSPSCCQGHCSAAAAHVWTSCRRTGAAVGWRLARGGGTWRRQAVAMQGCVPGHAPGRQTMLQRLDTEAKTEGGEGGDKIRVCSHAPGRAARPPPLPSHSIDTADTQPAVSKSGPTQTSCRP